MKYYRKLVVLSTAQNQGTKIDEQSRKRKTVPLENGLIETVTELCWLAVKKLRTQSLAVADLQGLRRSEQRTENTAYIPVTLRLTSNRSSPARLRAMHV